MTPPISHRPVSNMRLYTRERLLAMTNEDVITHHGRPIAVVMPMALYTSIQKELQAWTRAVDEGRLKAAKDPK